MPVPRLVVPKYKSSEVNRKADRIVSKLCDMGYDICDERDAIHVIECDNLDKSQFDYPYGSYGEFKKRVLEGEFDIDTKIASKEQHDVLMKKVKEGKLWITH